MSFCGLVMRGTALTVFPPFFRVCLQHTSKEIAKKVRIARPFRLVSCAAPRHSRVIEASSRASCLQVFEANVNRGGGAQGAAAVRNFTLWFPCSRCHLACNSHSSDHPPQWGPLPQPLRFRVVGGGRRGRGGAAQNLTVFHHLAQRKDGLCGFKCYICLGIQVSTTLPTAWRRATREIPPDCPCPGAKCLTSCMFSALPCPVYAVCAPFF